MSYGYSQLDLVNQVLSNIGRESVDNINVSFDSRFINEKLIFLLPQVLQLAGFYWALKFRSDSTPLTQSISPEWVYTYQLPPDFGQIFRLAQNMWQVWMLMDNYILSNQRPFDYYYVVNNADTSVLTPLFADALTLFVAYRVARTLTNDEGLTGDLKKEWYEKRDDCIRQNDMQRLIFAQVGNGYNRVTFV